MFARWFRTMAAPHWLGLFGLVVAGWVALYLMAIPADLRSLSRIYGAEFWAELCRVTPDGAGAAKLWAMWALMSAAMMLPTALPALATYDDLPTTKADFAALTGGYLAIWLGFSAVAALAQLGLWQMGLVDQTGLSLSRILSGALLIGAGVYQFTALKNACVSKCRAPLAFFMDHWSDGPWRLGLRLGAVCLGCCWALMALAFVGGVMSLAFMGLATLLMVFEKLPSLGDRLTRPLGFGLIGAGALVLAGL
ncbi:MAG: putative metal-binding membrane protein [Paracoccaceae bacterium]|jgi:predicted metal-binding membrane protein